MSITNSKKGVWNQNEVVKKVNANRWTSYSPANDPTRLDVFGSTSLGGENGLNVGAQNLSSPTQLSGTTWCKISFGAVSAGIRCDNTLWIWGDNTRGQLGQSDLVHRSSPTQIPGTNWCDVSVGSEVPETTILALKTDNTLWGWGSNVSGELGINNATTSYYSSPVQIPGATWCKISAGIDNHAALRTDNTLWVWGWPLYGANGLNDITIYYSSPTQLPGTWIDMSMTNGGGTAIKSDNTLWVWGRSNNGQLGQNNRVHRSSPTQVPGTTWCKVSAGFTSVVALKTDNTLWVWGSSLVGQLGFNNRVGRSSPTQIPGTTWCKACMGCDRMLVERTDKTLWASGANTPINNTTLEYRSSPTQIPGSCWIDISVGVCTSGLLKY